MMLASTVRSSRIQHPATTLPGRLGPFHTKVKSHPYSLLAYSIACRSSSFSSPGFDVSSFRPELHALGKAKGLVFPGLKR